MFFSFIVSSLQLRIFWEQIIIFIGVFINAYTVICSRLWKDKVFIKKINFYLIVCSGVFPSKLLFIFRTSRFTIFHKQLPKNNNNAFFLVLRIRSIKFGVHHWKDFHFLIRLFKLCAFVMLSGWAFFNRTTKIHNNVYIAIC